VLDRFFSELAAHDLRRAFDASRTLVDNYLVWARTLWKERSRPMPFQPTLLTSYVW